ncbi:uncharacterized protein LOC125989243 isoform X2 [Xyrichtys novacula]|uniref:Uncharacterized protein LOC125989243 isoform X2 n=1 Tax=Xyrichtys novacula TaxID=13765 RepID=A0AAV1HDM3_XYRNO|nr:uncharacterized protein LOC125989243 isoform X2 [Xyrichtys novacula]
MCGQKKPGEGQLQRTSLLKSEELALSLDRGRPATEGIKGGMTSDPGGGSSLQSSCFVQVDSDTLTVTLLPPPKQTLPSTEEEANPAAPEPVASTSRPAKTRESQNPGADTVRALYKRQLEEDIECKALQKKV